MEHSYSGLTELISQDAQARAYFMSLPDYVQGMIQQRNDNVRTADTLYRHAAQNRHAGTFLNRAYSTVTLLARLRGLSMSQWRASAM